MLIKFDKVEPAPSRSRLGKNKVRPVGVGRVVERGGQYEMLDRLYESGGYQAGYQVWVETKAKVGDLIEAQPWMGGC